jgi:hypothetical protein
MSALLDLAKLRELANSRCADSEPRPKFDIPYRIGSMITVTDGCLIVRVAGESIGDLETLPEFPSQREVTGWRFPTKLFRCDRDTLADWAECQDYLLLSCESCLDFDDSVDCADCAGTGSAIGPPSFGWLTPRRLVDRRYVELIAMVASNDEVIDVRAQSPGHKAIIRFRGRGWDAFLAPFEPETAIASDVWVTAAHPLWTPQRVLEGDNA